METPTRRNQLGRRSIIARIGALLALIACGVAIYFVVMSFTESQNEDDDKGDRKNRSEQRKDNNGQASAAAFAVTGLPLS
jgi:hypothetical protein